MSTEPTLPNEDLLSAYLDGECTDEERAWVDVQLSASAGARAVLDDVRVARDAVRSLPLRDAPPEFWARLLDPDGTGIPPVPVLADASGRHAEVAAGRGDELAARRAPHRPGRWVAAIGGAAAAAVIAALVLVPEPKSVDPPVGAFTDAHAVRASLQDDAVSSLAPLAVQVRTRR
ncbi:MAG: hypothetical protein AMXMBFR46_13980 [Acidimicrobiia bacterium]